MLWSRNNLPQVAGVLLLQEQFEWGLGVWLKQREEQIVQEARKVDIAGHGYRLDQESYIPWQPDFHHTQWCAYWFVKAVCFSRNIMDWLLKTAISNIEYVTLQLNKWRGISLAVQWLRPKKKKKKKQKTRNQSKKYSSVPGYFINLLLYGFEVVCIYGICMVGILRNDVLLCISFQFI